MSLHAFRKSAAQKTGLHGFFSGKGGSSDNNSERDPYVSHAERQASYAHELTPFIPNLIHAADIERELIDKHDNFLFDCDGVLWRWVFDGTKPKSKP
jgi:hypothetical protein